MAKNPDSMNPSSVQPAFTPGPWRPGHIVYDNHPCECRYIFGNDDRMGAVGEVYLDDGENDCPPLVEAKANIHLIAAAPELYEALDNLLLAFLAITHEDQFVEVEAARAALLRARGGDK